MLLRLPKRLRDPFTALLLFGAAGIVAMILAFVVTALPRLGAPASPVSTNAQQQVAPPALTDPSPSPTDSKHDHGHGHGGGGQGQGGG